MKKILSNELEESLTKDYLNSLQQKIIYSNGIIDQRPSSNFIDLMNWVMMNFTSSLIDKKNLNKFVHNRIIIDGQFILFCKQNNINIECLYKDSVISWRTDSSSEKFFIQGIFLIKSKDVEFIHCALFHKANQNEDEVSFFVIVSENNYNSYVELRNKFDDWIKERDRSTLSIKVIDGEDIPYTKDYSWDDVFLPENIKSNIKSLVEGFLSSKDFYLNNRIPWKRGLLLYGNPGCHAKGTLILMHDGSYKKVEEIVVGDRLMGPDCSSREVLSLVRGKEEMYCFYPKKGNKFIVNKNHILHLNYNKFPYFVNIPVCEYLLLPKKIRSNLKLIKQPKINKKIPLLERCYKKSVTIKSVEYLNEDDYYGFVVDKDHLYLMDGNYITHNCGKTSIIKTLISVYNFKPVTVIPEISTEGIREAFSYAEEQSPSLLYFEDLDSLLSKNVDISAFLNLMDGISSKNGLFVLATANDISKLKKNITDRPSRFDRKVEIPIPNQEMAYIYLKRWFGSFIDSKKCKELSEYSFKNNFSYAYLKELYISSIFEALSNNRKKPTINDINKSLSLLIKDKNLLNEKEVKIDKYL